jgi:nucleotide-binding universal stress UspA family protein
MSTPETPGAAPILFCFDGSPGSREALEEAGRLLAPREAFVLTVWPTVAARLASDAFTGASMSYVANERELDSSEEAGARLAAEEGAAAARAHGWDATPRVEVAREAIWRTVVETADALDAALVVCGARGLNPFKRALLGSVSDAVLHHTRRPALIVHQSRP